MIYYAGSFIAAIIIVVLLAQIGVSKIKYKGEDFNIFIKLSMFFMVVFIGFRKGVGTDYLSYSNLLYRNEGGFIIGESFEFGYLLLRDLILYFNLGISGFFVITSLITTILLYKPFKGKEFLLPVALLFFFIGDYYSFSINIVRQGISVAAFFLAINYLNEGLTLRNLIYYTIAILAGAMFHYTVLLFAPLVLLKIKNYNSLFTSKSLLIIVLLSLVINQGLLQWVINNGIFDNIFKYLPRYERFVALGLFDDFNKDWSLGYYLILFANIIPVIFYDQIVKKEPQAAIYIILFSIGVAMQNIFGQNEIFRRMYLYLYLLGIYSFSYLYQYIRTTKKDHAILLLSFGFVVFIYILRNVIYLEHFMEVQVEEQFSLWFITFSK